MIKRIFSLLCALSVFCWVTLTAYAHDVPQERSDCSIQITVRYDGENVHGGTLTAIKVGYVDQDDGNYFFRREMDHVRLDDVQGADAAGDLQEFYENNKDKYTFYKQTAAVENGNGKFSGLSTGLYLIIQEEAASGFSKLNAFLIGVPTLENNEYQYHVTASVKSELERETEPTDPPPTEPPDPTLPQTGQLKWPIPLMTVSGLILFLGGWILRFGKKRERHEI